MLQFQKLYLQSVDNNSLAALLNCVLFVTWHVKPFSESSQLEILYIWLIVSLGATVDKAEKSSPL